MANLVQLKQEIQFNQRLGGLLDALKSIAAQQFQALERTLRTNPVCTEAVRKIAGTFDLEHFSHPMTQRSGPVGVIIVTSDTGLLGGLNQQVVSTGLQEYRRQPGELMVVGERGVAYVREHGLACHTFNSVQEHERRALVAKIRDYAINQVLSGKLASLAIAYPRALSFTMQRVEIIRILPCWEWFRDSTAPRGVLTRGSILLESTISEVLEYLVWFWLGQQLHEVFLQSRLAELAARSVHLEGSSQELQRRGKKLRLRYFRERHEVIDRSMRELFAAKAIFAQQN